MKNTLIIGILALIVLFVILSKKKKENFVSETEILLKTADDFILDGLDHPEGKDKIHRHHSF